MEEIKHIAVEIEDRSISKKQEVFSESKNKENSNKKPVAQQVKTSPPRVPFRSNTNTYLQKNVCYSPSNGDLT